MHTDVGDRTLALIGPIGWQEMLIIGVIMLLLFGRRLPEVGRSLGQGITQFKKGLRDAQDEVENAAKGDGASRTKVGHTEPQRFDTSSQHGSHAPTQPAGEPAPAEHAQPKTDAVPPSAAKQA